MVGSRDAPKKLDELNFRLLSLTARLVTGGTAALVALSACYALFGPYSDLSAMQLAAGPGCTQPGESHRAGLSPRAGRGCASTEAERTASSTATTRIARAAAAPMRTR